MKRELGPFWRTISTLIGLAITGIALNYVFNLQLFDKTMQETVYLAGLSDELREITRHFKL